MNDMRLPGISLVNNEPSVAPNNDAPRDPAQAFDAVMSRFANDKPAPAPNPNTNPPANNASRPSNTNRANNADESGKSTKETKGSGAANNTAASATPRTDAKSPAGPGGRTNQTTGHPAARTKPKDADAADSEASDAAAKSTPDAVVQAVADAAQLAQNPALAAMVNSVVVPVTGKDEKAAGDTKEITDGSVGKRGAIDTIASEANTLLTRNTDKTPVDPRAAVTADDAAAPATGNRRAAPGQKDTLRIDAPLMRPFEATKADLVERLSSAANAVVQAATPHAAATQALDVASPALAAAAIGATAPATTYSIAHAAVATPLGTAGFAGELAQRVVVFAGQKVQRAEISVTPAELGPIAVSIEVRGQEATLAFAASSHTTRAAIEDALPRLRDMLSAQGLQLMGTHVGSEPRRDSYRPARDGKASPGVDNRDGIAAVSAPATTPIRRAVNLIDIEV